MATTSGSAVAEYSTKGHCSPREVLAVQEDRGTADDQKEDQEYRHQKHRLRALHERFHIEAHPADHEEEGHQETKADGVHLRAKWPALLAPTGETDHHARRESAEHGLE